MSVLDDIITGVREDLEDRRRSAPPAAVRDAAASAPRPLDAAVLLADRSHVRLICEVKRKSPSKGRLASIPDPALLAASYAEGGADAISVLTERRRFGGSLDDLRAVRARVGVPVLRKDFVVDPYQVDEARAAGADLVLLIVAALPGDALAELYAQITELGMTALVEAHTIAEAERAVALGAPLIGANARDLTTLDVDPARVADVLAMLPAETVKVAESGVASPRDVAAYVRAGADAVLTGEALVRSGDPRAAVARFRAAGDAALPVTTSSKELS